jgi:hypothetical protein
MSNVHFIWWGPNGGDHCTKTPNDVARASGKSGNVVFWCKKEHAESFRAKLDPSVEIRHCDTVRDVDPKLADGPDALWAQGTDEALAGLHEQKAFSAIKDVLSLVVLKAHGGYYFDTTTQVADEALSEKYKARSLAEALAETPDAPRVALIAREGQAHYPGIQTRQAILFGRDGEGPEPIGVPLVDVWAMYSPKDHPAMDLMWKSYISRYNRLTPPEPEAQASSSLHAELASDVASTSQLPHADSSQSSQACPMKSLDEMTVNDMLNDRGPEGLRNLLIGNLVMRSVYDGLLASCAKFDGDAVVDYSWPTEKLDKEDTDRTRASLIVPGLGIAKEYKNSWR